MYREKRTRIVPTVGYNQVQWNVSNLKEEADEEAPNKSVAIEEVTEVIAGQFGVQS